MKTTYHLTRKSANVKTGPIPVTTTGRDTCPTSCPFKGNGCYADNAPLRFHWDKVTNGTRGGTLDALCESIARFPADQLWRHNQGGDLPGKGDRIDSKGLQALTAANKGRRGFTYTHKPLTAANKRHIRAANDGGFVVNVSANKLSEVDKAKAANVGPVCVTVGEDHGKQTIKTPAGHRVVTCPATYRDDISCADCKLCAIPGRECVIAFPVHGAKKRAAQLVTLG